MIHYHIEAQNPTAQFIQIRLSFTVSKISTVKLQLPAWRAGRYYLANYAQNIRNFQAKDAEGIEINSLKVSKDLWELTPKQTGKVEVSYEYYCAKMDAGACWVDDEQVYLNFVNCCFELKGRQDEEIQVKVVTPKEYLIAATLLQKNGVFSAKDFQQLADSSFLASQTLKSDSYQVQGTLFHLWFHGEIHFDLQQFKSELIKFTEKQIEAFGEFPVSEYHFIFQLLPYPHYHGVEHQRGTVITFGPAASLSSKKQMDELLGVTCHELYHAWNVCQIRPKEIMPYDFSKEAYHQAGWMVEGVTTYMGDIFLLKSGYFSISDYCETFEKILNREAMNFGWKNHSILESSHDLWLDGYMIGIPDRKVSIYTHGALIAFCLDSMLLDETSSLHVVMSKLWEKYGKSKVGYQLDEVWETILSQTKQTDTFKDFYKDYISGNADIFPLVEKHMNSLGIKLRRKAKEDSWASNFGIIRQENGKITKLHPASPAYKNLMLGDIIRTIKPNQDGLELTLERYGRNLTVFVPESEERYFMDYELSVQESTSKRTRWAK
ncbi:M61 family peptidase [Algoriphagus halophytocola]|uniref:M61 family peptidase n=1 Tax=Algoriphagus halophytocola TaxID=2991499 RepID=A0ABY6MEZ8_9BACT|nr:MULTISPECIES: M61 family peptidase [unclassified Algoriphagus]UZD22203.1 M61 family peptidase [Algoriphagus sp. TR-M5]WBL43453.1 M61 family peptidase [Algoriphagus sp. TR-M9]